MTLAPAQGIGLDPGRNYPETWALRQIHETRPTEKGHLAATVAEKLEANPQSLKRALSPHERMVTLRVRAEMRRSLNWPACVLITYCGKWVSDEIRNNEYR